MTTTTMMAINAIKKSIVTIVHMLKLKVLKKKSKQSIKLKPAIKLPYI